MCKKKIYIYYINALCFNPKYVFIKYFNSITDILGVSIRWCYLQVWMNNSWPLYKFPWKISVVHNLPDSHKEWGIQFAVWAEGKYEILFNTCFTARLIFIWTGLQTNIVCRFGGENLIRNNTKVAVREIYSPFGSPCAAEVYPAQYFLTDHWTPTDIYMSFRTNSFRNLWQTACLCIHKMVPRSGRSTARVVSKRFRPLYP
jgi:hypothetical protein